MIKDESGKEHYGCIYIITNIINTKIYIGQTINFKARKVEHFCGRKCNTPIRNSINLHGKDKFNMKIIEYCDSLDDMNEAEEFYIIYYKIIGATLYNIKAGGNNRKLPEETKLKISKSQTGKKASEETRKKISKLHFGSKKSDETKLKISKNNIGKHHKTPQQSKAISEAQSVPIIIIDKFGNEYKFSSVVKASETLNISRSGIFDVLALNQNIVGDNYKVKYENVKLEENRINKEKELNKIKDHKKTLISIDKFENKIEFKTKEEAAKILNISLYGISKVRNGKLKSTGGYKFIFMDKE